MICTKP